MTIGIGDAIPHASVRIREAAEDEIRVADAADYLGTGRVVLFSVPGAFTPTCSARHLPGFVDAAEAFKAAGVDRVVCLAVNDPFVLAAWASAQNAWGRVVMMADGNAEFSRALGLDDDKSNVGMGIRGRRFALVIEAGVVRHAMIEEPGRFEVSSAASVLAALRT